MVIFGYRRADHLEKVLRALAAEDLAKTTLCILCLDGPKTPGEQRQIDRVRNVARADWGFGEIQIRAAKANQGLVRSITSGVTDVCREHGQAIVLEDDIVPRKGFLDFMNEALEKYRDTPRVMQVSGYAYPVSAEPPRHSFLPLTSCWGWATWQRAWQQYGWNPDLGRADLNNPDFLRRFDLQGAYPYSRLLRDVLEGKSDSWGVIWYWNVFRSGGLTLFPAQSLVDNIGWDGTGEHNEAHPLFQKSDVFPPEAKAAWPKEIQTSEDDLSRLFNLIRTSRKSNYAGPLRRLGKKIAPWLQF